ncbi:hypothetical protein BAUCODRAFT_148187 [Baudoinia panamericana UAMH 10762]|uniref:Mediator of RNA polymerase II transcription subunit 21 n=1 Tax=Baudoinia panamericana (strain UAMH 10762) TaxID=717646 RepID=M2NCJ2_BAUPA|nr:uncharacterized protein BAUCODRAFT_148187 [Baudoinia panamericana UAMH 10762]EMC96605.1 hypothetical protein BAUCODRAFT_148187 [Baudoinia panamericana UAMH 10762]
MADRLTQLQDAIDNQQTLMYAAINYITTRHPYAEIPGQPSQAPQLAKSSAPDSAVPQSAVSSQIPNGEPAKQQPNGAAPSTQIASDALEAPGSPPPEERDTFNAALHELARDLVLQEQQIELLINSLPGLGNSEASQMRRMRELEAALREMGSERAIAEQEKERMVDALGQMLTQVQRVP